ncbi:unnamed protein product, partial [Heterotrigona itama]
LLLSTIRVKERICEYQLFVSGATCLVIPEELPTILSLVYSNIPPIKKGDVERRDERRARPAGSSGGQVPTGTQIAERIGEIEEDQGAEVDKYRGREPKPSSEHVSAERDGVPDKPTVQRIGHQPPESNGKGNTISNLKKLYESQNNTETGKRTT